MGESMTVFVERRKDEGDSWQLDEQSSGPVSEEFGARGISIPRGRDLYYMIGYPDDGCEDYELHVEGFFSRPVEKNRFRLAGADTFWAVRSRHEVGIVQRCYVVSHYLHPKDIEKADEWKISFGKVLRRMKEIEKEGDEVRLVVHVE
jgi:hypothetical protein